MKAMRDSLLEQWVQKGCFLEFKGLTRQKWAIFDVPRNLFDEDLVNEPEIDMRGGLVVTNTEGALIDLWEDEDYLHVEETLSISDVIL